MTKLKHYSVPSAFICPVCKAVGEALTGINTGDSLPAPESFMICSGCGSFTKWDKSMQLRAATAADLLKIGDKQRQQLEAIRMRVVLMQQEEAECTVPSAWYGQAKIG